MTDATINQIPFPLLGNCRG